MRRLRIQVTVAEPALVAAIEARVRDGLSAGYAEAVIDLLKQGVRDSARVDALARCGGGPAPAPAAQEEERLTF